MKLKKVAFVTSVWCMLASSLFATSADAEGKVYISKDAIALTDEGMFVNWGDQYVPVDSVHCDESGYYLVAEGLAEKFMYCGKCGESHSGKCRGK